MVIEIRIERLFVHADLERDGHAVWDGVANPTALINLRAMKAGDRAFIYHSGDEKQIVGVAEITKVGLS